MYPDCPYRGLQQRAFRRILGLKCPGGVASLVTSSAPHSEGSSIESPRPEQDDTNASRFVKANLVTAETGGDEFQLEGGLNLSVTLRNLIRI